MRTVYVLGAGFSHNYNSEVFPLVRTFLSLAKANKHYWPEDNHQQLAFVIRKYFRDDIYPDLEKVLTFLSAAPLDHRTIPFEHRPIIYDELIEIIVRVLSDASKEDPESQLIKEAYERFAAHLNDTSSTVITFNYDLLIESLLMRTHKWHTYDGYGVNIPVAYDAMPTSPHTIMKQRLQDVTTLKWPSVTLLKLHGSINWVRPTMTGDRGDDIYQIPFREGISQSDFALRTDFGAPFTLRFKPVIVPPVLDKTFWLKNPSFRVIWNMAMEAIDEADRITFIGYSLPLTDFMAEFLFRQGLNMRSAERRIVVVDPNAAELKERYFDVFGSISWPLEIMFKECDFVSYANSALAPAT